MALKLLIYQLSKAGISEVHFFFLVLIFKFVQQKN